MALTIERTPQKSEQQTTPLESTTETLAKKLDPIYTGSQSLLRWCWIGLIPSFGLSLIPMWFVIITRYLWPFPPSKQICRLGDEWLPTSQEDNTLELAEFVTIALLTILYCITIYLLMVALFVAIDAYTNPVTSLLRALADFFHPGSSPAKAPSSP